MINKKKLVKQISEESGYNQTIVLEIVNKTFETIVSDLINYNEVSVTKFGKFRTKKYPAKKGTNPKNGNNIDIPENYRIFFKPSNNLKLFINNYLLEKDKKEKN